MPAFLVKNEWIATLLGSLASKSSWEEYTNANPKNFCNKGVVLSQFKNILEYKKFAQESLEIIKTNKVVTWKLSFQVTTFHAIRAIIK